MLRVTYGIPEQELVSLVTTKLNAWVVIPESGLVQEGILITPTPVVMKQYAHHVMSKDKSKPLATY